MQHEVSTIDAWLKSICTKNMLLIRFDIRSTDALRLSCLSLNQGGKSQLFQPQNSLTWIYVVTAKMQSLASPCFLLVELSQYLSTFILDSKHFDKSNLLVNFPTLNRLCFQTPIWYLIYNHRLLLLRK